MNKANECTCPSGDGSLVHPCPAHPAVEQAGGDEHEPLPYWEPCNLGCDPEFNGKRSRHCAQLCHGARTALAQPSPAQAEAERPEVAEVAFVLRNIGAMDAEDIDGDNVDLRFEDAEGRDTGCDVSIVEYAEKAADLFEQHDRIVGELRAVITQLRQHKNDYMDAGRETYRALQNEIREREAEIARLDGLVSGRTAERDAALARVAELERQEPVATVAKVPGEDWNSLDFHRDLQDMQPGTKLYAAPVAQAQQLNDLDKQCRDDVARALGLRPNQERGFAWSYLLASIKSCVKASGDSAQAQHSVPEGWMLVECGIWTQEQVDEMQKTVTRFRNSEFVDDRALAMAVADAGQCKAPEISLAELLAAAPGNSVPQAWLDVQAERRRQITAEGWTPEHDDEHADGQMAQAAGCYALHAGGIGTDWPDGRQNGAALFWPWDKDSWKPTTPRRDLVKACALALAEIERLDRAGISQSPQPGATTASS